MDTCLQAQVQHILQGSLHNLQHFGLSGVMSWGDRSGDEGSSDDLVSAAMAAGAAGASIAKVKQLDPAGAFEAGNPGKPLAREVCYMIINNDNVTDIIEALEQAACFTDEHNGIVVTSETIKAFTYLPST